MTDEQTDHSEGEAPKEKHPPGRHPENKKNWFRPGKSGNPTGRPKGSINLTSRLKKQLRENPEQANAIIANLIALASDGDFRALNAIKVILDRVDGPVKQKVEVEAAGEQAAALREQIRGMFETVPTEAPPGYEAPPPRAFEADPQALAPKTPSETPLACVDCGTLVSKSTVTCPSCGKDPRTGETYGAPAE